MSTPVLPFQTRLLNKLIQSFQGQPIELTIDDEPMELSLDGRLQVAYRRLDLRLMAEEMPAVRDLIWSGFWFDLKGQSHTHTDAYMFLPSLVIQVQNDDLFRLDEASRQSLIGRIQDELLKLGASVQLRWEPVRLYGMEIIDLEDENEPVEVIELQGQEWQCRCVEMAYRRLADLEENILIEMKEKRYPCSNLQGYMERLQQVIQEIAAGLENEVGIRE